MDTITQLTTEINAESVIYDTQLSLSEKYAMAEVGTGEVLEDTSMTTGKQRPWSRYKKQNAEMAELLEDETIKGSVLSVSRVENIRDCSNFLLFGKTAFDGYRLVHANFCKFKFCPLCSWRRSLKLGKQVSDITDVILQRLPSTRFLFLTLTVKNVEGSEISSQINAMNKAFKAFIGNTGTFALAKRLKGSLLGYMRCIEVTYNKQDKTFHPHIHVLLAVKAGYFKSGNYLKHDDYRELWKRCMGLDYEPMVNIQTIKNGTSKAIAEVAKYPTKTADILSLENNTAVGVLRTLIMQLNRKRLVVFGGIFKDVKAELNIKDIEEDDDLIHTDDSTQINFIGYTLFQYRYGIGLYIC